MPDLLVTGTWYLLVVAAASPPFETDPVRRGVVGGTAARMSRAKRSRSAQGGGGGAARLGAADAVIGGLEEGLDFEVDPEGARSDRNARSRPHNSSFKLAHAEAISRGQDQ